MALVGVKSARPEEASGVQTTHLGRRPLHQNSEKQCASAVLIWAQATLLSVSMMSIPSAQNSPRFCCDVRLITFSSTRHLFDRLGLRTQAEACATAAPERPFRGAPTECVYAFTAGGSGFGALSPIRRTLLSSSDICMPERASKSAGTCAAIFVMSPVSL